MQDCGTCVQIVVNLAKKDGVPTGLIKAALRADEPGLPAPLAEVLQFSREIARGSDALALREKLTAAYGETAFMELTPAVTTAKVYPTLKRAIGQAVSCCLVRVDV